jgi:hypothetical protein
MAISNDWLKLFYSIPMHQLLKYMLSQNCESQVLAIDANAENIQTTGTKMAIINGTPVQLAADAEYDISAEAAYAAWATSQSYTLNTEVTDEDGKHYVCISAHTSGASTKPTSGADWQTKWKRLDKFAVDAKGNVVAQDKQAWYLVCALNDGTLRAFLAYTPGTEAATTDIVIPAYDPERYVPVGLLAVKPTSGSHTLGTTVLTTVGTFFQLCGPVLPDANKLDLN